ncbi:NAD(P)-dependent oxidoreductase [Lentilactobacillus kosonis]|uniref:Rrf2-linked NADH-flavin reductase n=1 Tax=Lentilactobacillus kosonis TaxID=2810561 RepID=A0A401FJJ1_9LACO|nr:NAD(P)H-binding protein [Lentilactobacillus kosonis]GAY72529.1 Rrf2-linked NADH-flavin reductase [Lentilactobacillus kosonis]
MTIKIGVIGASGMAGSAITENAVDRGFDVTAVVRNVTKAKDKFGDQIDYLEKDAFDLTYDDIQGFDALIDAFAPGSESLASKHTELATKLIKLVQNHDKPRLGFILGAASLNIGNGKQLLDQLVKMPDSDEWIATPKAQFEEYQILLTSEGVDWFAVSPSGTFEPGELTEYTTGSNDMLKNKNGKSIVYSKTLAKVLVDEIEDPKHHNERFTVVSEI